MGNYTAPPPNSGQGNFRNYSLGPVKPWVQYAANALGTQFDVDTIYGFSTRDAGTDAGHALGLAIDLMVYGDSEKGHQIATYAESVYKQLNIYYIIWQQHIWDYKRADEGWRLMPDRGSPTANHMDHVHISFNASGDAAKNFPGFPNKDPAPDLPWNKALSGIGNIKDLISWLGNGHNWFRIFLILAGGALIGFALIKMSKGTAIAGVGEIVTKSKALTKVKAAE